MRLIGYWMESLRDAKYFLPQEFIGDLSLETRNAVADYLDAGTVFEVYRGFSWCRICPDFENGYCELSDGHWVWPEGLAHYVREHRVVLPSAFIGHVHSKLLPIPVAQWERMVDEEFWHDWCRTNASGQYRCRIALAQETATLEAESRLAEAAAELELREGISEKRCLWSGCKRSALLRKLFCARCIINAQPDIYSGSVYHKHFDAVIHDINGL